MVQKKLVEYNVNARFLELQKINPSEYFKEQELWFAGLLIVIF